MARVLKAVYELLSPKEKRRAAGVAVLMFVTAFFELLGVGSILPFLTIAMEPEIVHRNEALSWAYSTLGFENLTGFIIFAGVAMLAIVVLANLVSAFAMWVHLRFVYGVGHTISTRLMDRYLAQPYGYFLTHNTSRLSRNILAETTKLVTGILSPAAALLSRGIVVVAVVGFLIAVEPRIVLSTLVIIGGTYAVVYALVRHRLGTVGRLSVLANQQRYKANAETFGGIKDIKALAREAYFLRQYADASSRFARHQATNQIYSQLPQYLIQIMVFGAFTVSFIFLVGSGRSLSEVVPLMGFFAFAAIRLMPGFQGILSALAHFRFHEHMLFEIHSDLTQTDGRDRLLATPREQVPALRFDHHITVERVRFRYAGAGKDVIPDLTLEISKNSSVALVGSTGAGKTTIADIVLGLLAPQEGSVSVDGTPITAETVTAWRKNVGYVPQDVFLIDDTVTKNIAYGVDRKEIDREAVETAAKIAHIHEFIVSELPEGYDTVIGERGVRISGGQRQRLGIARALYHDPDVLVLDEATSDIDSITEAHITEAIQGLAGKKTLIIVAHRLATIRRCDRIVLLEAGEIVASGTYDELAGTNVEFQRMTHGVRVEAVR